MFLKKITREIESIKNKMKSFFKSKTKSQKNHQQNLLMVMEEKPAKITIWKQEPQRLFAVKEKLCAKSIKDYVDKMESNLEIINSCDNLECRNCGQCIQGGL